MRPGPDSTKVRLAVDSLTGKAGGSETKSDSQCRTVRVLAALSSMLALTGTSPTTILVFSGGLAKPEQKIIDMTRRNAPTEAGAAAATNDVCPVRPEDYENIGVLASSARADLYLFHLTESMASAIVRPGRRLREPGGRHRRGIRAPHGEPAGLRLAPAARDRRLLHRHVRSGSGRTHRDHDACRFETDAREGETADPSVRRHPQSGCESLPAEGHVARCRRAHRPAAARRRSYLAHPGRR